jgi:hypothetical protein
VRDGQGRLVFLYEISNSPLKRYRAYNYPYIDAQLVVTQTEGEAASSLRAIAGQGGAYRTLEQP